MNKLYELFGSFVITLVAEIVEKCHQLDQLYSESLNINPVYIVNF